MCTNGSGQNEHVHERTCARTELSQAIDVTVIISVPITITVTVTVISTITITVTVTITVTDTNTADGDDGTDTLVNFNEIIGTSGDDQFTADSNYLATYVEETSTISGNAFRGGGGDDIITGSGNTRAVYSDATGSVTVDLTTATGSAFGAGVGTDTLTGVDRITGSAFDDVFTGGLFNGVNTFRGGAGDDIIDGTAGLTRVDYHDPGATQGVTVDLGTVDGSGNVIVIDGFGDTDAASATARGGLDHHRKANLFGNGDGLSDTLNAPIGPRHHRHAQGHLAQPLDARGPDGPGAGPLPLGHPVGPGHLSRLRLRGRRRR